MRRSPKSQIPQPWGNGHVFAPLKTSLEKSNPNKVFRVIREKRAKNSWAHYRVCVLIPEQGQKQDKKSQIKGKRSKAPSRSALDISSKI